MCVVKALSGDVKSGEHSHNELSECPDGSTKIHKEHICGIDGLVVPMIDIVGCERRNVCRIHCDETSKECLCVVVERKNL